MLFNSVVFPLFFFVVWLLYIFLQHRYQNVLLLIASYVFYGWWDWRFLFLLAISTVVDFNCARRIEASPENRKRWLLVSITTNLGILGFFKYFNFFADSSEQLLASLGFQADAFTLTVILPVGISFYTFQTLAYTIDVYRGHQKATSDPIAFSLYVSYFPQLVAGPIERSRNLLPKIQAPRQITPENIYSGLQLVLMGYFKKVFIADGVATYVDSTFDAPFEHGGVRLLMTVYLFAFQIYGDFSGYTDIARGISRLLGIELCLNFRQPYLASNITEFWRRWHISLSSWLRDYLYIPLGGNRRGQLRTYINNMLTMLIGGLWHGAGWTFVVWGGLHGTYLCVHKFLLKGKAVPSEKWPTGWLDGIIWVVKVFCTFNLVCLAWIFFRAESLSSATSYIHYFIHNPPFENAKSSLLHFVFYGMIVFGLDIACFMRSRELPFGKGSQYAVQGMVYSAMIVALLMIGEDVTAPFIYFQF